MILDDSVMTLRQRPDRTTVLSRIAVAIPALTGILSCNVVSPHTIDSFDGAKVKSSLAGAKVGDWIACGVTADKGSPIQEVRETAKVVPDRLLVSIRRGQGAGKNGNSSVVKIPAGELLGLLAVQGRRHHHFRAAGGRRQRAGSLSGPVTA